MKQMRIIYLLMAVAALLVASCSSHDDDNVPMQTVTMPIKLSIPAEGFTTPTDYVVNVGDDNSTHAIVANATRATEAGDPGSYEKFSLPQFLYLFIVNKASDKSYSVIYKKIDLTEIVEKGTPLTDLWKKELAANGDSLYTYTGDISIDLPLDRVEGQFYAVASSVDINTDKNTQIKYNSEALTSNFTVANYDAFTQNLIYTANSKTEYVEFQNIYSSPYNKTKDVNGTPKYYGYIQDYTSKVPHLDLILYHIAAKIDISWSVKEDLQSSLYLSLFETRYMYKQSILFRPMEATVSSTNFSLLKYDLAESQKCVMTPANQWYGRHVIYTLPYTYTGKKTTDIDVCEQNRFLVRIRMQTNGNEGKGNQTSGYNKIVNIDLLNNDANGNPQVEVDANGKAIYTPWIRGVVRINSNIVYNID